MVLGFDIATDGERTLDEKLLQFGDVVVKSAIVLGF